LPVPKALPPLRSRRSIDGRLGSAQCCSPSPIGPRKKPRSTVARASESNTAAAARGGVATPLGNLPPAAGALSRSAIRTPGPRTTPPTADGSRAALNRWAQPRCRLILPVPAPRRPAARHQPAAWRNLIRRP
jgi:hypothetical protein